MRFRSAIATARFACVLTDDVLVELGDDLPGRQRFGGGDGGFRKIDRHSVLEDFDRDVDVRVDADGGGDAHRFVQRSAGRRERYACASAFAAAMRIRRRPTQSR